MVRDPHPGYVYLARLAPRSRLTNGEKSTDDHSPPYGRTFERRTPDARGWSSNVDSRVDPP